MFGIFPGTGEGEDSLVVTTPVVLDTAEVIVRFSTAGEGAVAVVIRHGWHHYVLIGGVDPVLVEGHGVKQGIVGLQPAAVQRCGINRPQHCQGAVGPSLDIGFYIVEYRGRLTVAAASRQ